MIDTLLFDLIDTLVQLPYKPRDVIYPLLGLSHSAEVEAISDAVCRRTPNLDLDEYIKKVVEFSRGSLDDILLYEVRAIWQHCIDNAFLSLTIKDLVIKFKQQGYKLGIVSNATPASWGIVHRFGLEQLFDSVTLSHDVGYRKPHPQIYLSSLHSLCSQPELTCMVGNKWDTDIIGAIGVNAYAVLLGQWNDVPLRWRTNEHIIDCINDLPQLMQTITRFNSGLKSVRKIV